MGDTPSNSNIMGSKTQSQKRILILSLGVGGGHNSAARALDELARVSFPDTLITRWQDVFEYTSKAFRFAYADFYQMLVNYLPSLWGFLYERMQSHRVKKENRIITYIDARAYPRLIKAVKEFKPDIVLCTHFLPANVVTSKMPHIPVYVLVTDYDVHSFWINPKYTGYFVANEECKYLIESSGIPEARINITGIPVAPVFSENRERNELRKAYNVPEKSRVILLMGGGLGGRYLDIAVSEILSIPEEFTLITITGKNKKLYDSISKKFGRDSRIQVLEFTNKISHYMTMSDFVVTKAGGLTVTEAINTGLPLIVFCPTPGQEEENTFFLLESGVALRATNPVHLRYKVSYLLNTPAQIVKMKEMCRWISKPEAGKKIFKRLRS